MRSRTRQRVAVQIGLEVDEADCRYCRADTCFGRIDRRGKVAHRHVEIEFELGSHEEFVWAEMQRADMDDPTNVRRRAERCDDGILIDRRSLDALGPRLAPAMNLS